MRWRRDYPAPSRAAALIDTVHRNHVLGKIDTDADNDQPALVSSTSMPLAAPQPVREAEVPLSRWMASKSVTRLSSRFTAVSKWGLPLGWFGFFVVFLGASAEGGTSGSVISVLGALAIAALGFLAMWLLVCDLADSVLDGGSHLQIRRRGIEASIPFHDSADVRVSKYATPARVVLHLAGPSPLGSSVSFLPEFSFALNPFARSAVAQKLLQRALAARAQSDLVL